MTAEECLLKVLAEMWSELGTPEEVLEGILNTKIEDIGVDLEVIETLQGTITLIKPPKL